MGIFSWVADKLVTFWETGDFETQRPHSREWQSMARIMPEPEKAPEKTMAKKRKVVVRKVKNGTYEKFLNDYIESCHPVLGKSMNTNKLFNQFCKYSGLAKRQVNRPSFTQSVKYFALNSDRWDMEHVAKGEYKVKPKAVIGGIPVGIITDANGS